MFNLHTLHFVKHLTIELRFPGYEKQLERIAIFRTLENQCSGDHTLKVDSPKLQYANICFKIKLHLNTLTSLSRG